MRLNMNIIFQDNKSMILLQENGRKSAGKQLQVLNIRYFFLSDQVQKGNVTIKYCPTNKMIADYMTKLLQGENSKSFEPKLWVYRPGILLEQVS